MVKKITLSEIVEVPAIQEIANEIIEKENYKIGIFQNKCSTLMRLSESLRIYDHRTNPFEKSVAKLEVINNSYINLYDSKEKPTAYLKKIIDNDIFGDRRGVDCFNYFWIFKSFCYSRTKATGVEILAIYKDDLLIYHWHNFRKWGELFGKGEFVKNISKEELFLLRRDLEEEVLWQGPVQFQELILPSIVGEGNCEYPELLFIEDYRTEKNNYAYSRVKQKGIAKKIELFPLKEADKELSELVFKTEITDFQSNDLSENSIIFEFKSYHAGYYNEGHKKIDLLQIIAA